MKFNREELSNELLKNYILEHKTGKKYLFLKFKVITPILLVILAIIFLSHKIYNDMLIYGSTSEIDIIVANNEPVRFKPEDPGGMYIPNIDKQIYNKIDNSNYNLNEEVLYNNVKSFEQPINRDNIDNIQKIEDNNKDIKKIILSEKKSENIIVESSKLDEVEKEIENSNNQKNNQIINDDRPSNLVKNYHLNIKKEVQLLANDNEYINNSSKLDNIDNEFNQVESQINKTNQIATIVLKKNPNLNRNKRVIIVDEKEKSGYSLQLASFKNQSDVGTHWDFLKNKYSFLKDYSYYTQKVNLNEKGVFFRLKLGVFDNEKEAREICEKLIELNQGCIFVKN